MADLSQLETALRNADAAGDVPAARALSAEITRQRGTGSMAPLSPDKVAPKPEPFVPSGEKGLPNSIWDTSPEMLAGNPITRFATGAAGPALGMLQLGAHMQAPVYKALGIKWNPAEYVDEKLRTLHDLKEAGRAAQGDTGLDVPETAGMVLSPATLAAGKIKPAERLLGRMAQGAGIGGAAGLATPVDNADSDYAQAKLLQGGSGAVVGGLVPAVTAVASKAGKLVYHGLIEPWANPAAIKGRAYLEAAGDKTDEIAGLLTRNKQIVSGSQPTAGEAAAPAGRAEFNALQASAEKAKPSDYFALSQDQNQARVDALKEFAGNPAKRAEATAIRTAKAGPIYAKGEAASSWEKIPSDLLDRPSMKAALNRAEQLAKERGIPFGAMAKPGTLSPASGQDAQTLKLAFDDLIKLAPKSGIDTAELDALRDTRAAYIGWMEKTFPRLATARGVYKAASAPINQMDVGEELVHRLTPALREEGAQRAGVFSNAVRESAGAVKKATGEPRFQSLEDVLNGKQLQTVHAVQDDLARSDLAKELARRGAGAGPNAIDLATGNLEREAGGKIPNLLHRGAMLANAIITRMEGRVNKKLAAEMAAEMLNPPGVAKSLLEAQARDMRNKALADAILRAQNSGVAGITMAVGRNQGE